VIECWAAVGDVGAAGEARDVSYMCWRVGANNVFVEMGMARGGSSSASNLKVKNETTDEVRH
jgi:hypothetical protein